MELPEDAPIIVIASEEEYHEALARIRAASVLPAGTPETVEAAGLVAAVREWEREHGAQTVASAPNVPAH
jgi:hypothetical protein